MAVQPRAAAAPEAIGVGVPGAARTRRERHEIGEHAAVGVLVRKDVVEVDALVIIEQRGIGGPAVHMPRQLEHVVAVARLAGALGDEGSDSVGRAEMLAFRIAADDIAVMADDALPAEPRSGLLLAVSGPFLDAPPPAPPHTLVPGRR